MIELSADLEPYMMLFSVLVAMATIFAFIYFMKHQVKYSPVYKSSIGRRTTADVSSQRTANEQNAPEAWLSLFKYRCDDSDDVPPCFLSFLIMKEHKQGGKTCNANILHSSHRGF